MSKFIDLYDQIVERLDMRLGTMTIGVSEALAYLDKHPDQVPGRTVTESELWHAEMKLAAACSTEQAEDFLLALGITVVPDPEPTNAEKLEEALTEYGVGRGVSARGLARHLDEQGVKAIEGAIND